ncbi:MAG: protein translocase subunit SecF, partial [Deltaproteobacteria bacterium]|nr:protein translocase subunit SecF [Deltaproteobacteria bacterium]
MLEIIKNTNIDFMRLKKYTFAFSGSVILVGLYAIFQIYTSGANL